MANDHLPSDRVVSYIDILGFRDKVEKMKDDKNLYNEIKDILTYINTDIIQHNNYNDQLKDKYKAVLLSDSIVISSPFDIEEGRTEQFIIFATHSLVLYLINRNIIVRGGISKGWCYHDGNILFGKGFLNAHDLGENVARVPRIIVDDIIVDSLNKNFIKDKEHHLRCDSDGFWFINIFNTPYISDPRQSLDYEQLKSIRKNIKNGLKNSINDNYDIKAKYRWLAEQYNLSVDESNKISIPRLY